MNGTDDDAPGDDLLSVFGDYLDRGEEPPRDLIDATPEGQLAYAALLRVRDAAGDLIDIESDGAAAPAGWVEGILAEVQREVRSGRSIPLTHSSPRAALSITEGAVRALIRAAGDAVDGLLVGRSRLEGDVTMPGEPIVVRLDASVFWGESIPEAAERLRSAVAATLLQHTELNIAEIEVTVTDVHLRRTPDAPAVPRDDDRSGR
ncbi:MAG: Asp23/Gls24 family envelope stress response protein [Herbiconiux sp.]|nr:Asp23/Gls24 family envelope stress response protein [Herbiconiux sp.]